MSAITPTDILLDRLHLIPDELVALDQWVTWRNERAGDDATKIPYQAAAPGRRAKVNDPATWATFDKAVKAFADSLATDNPFSGIGFVFTEADPFIGIDLDDCVDGDVIHPAALHIIRALGGYAELSPSMTGVKVWTRGTLNIQNTGKQTAGLWGGQIEIYHRGRWFATTGMELNK